MQKRDSFRRRLDGDLVDPEARGAGASEMAWNSVCCWSFQHSVRTGFAVENFVKGWLGRRIGVSSYGKNREIL